MRESRKMAFCSMLAALSVVLMVVGAAIGVGMYVSPMFAGLCLLPVGREYGRKYQIMIWLAVSLLSFMLVAEVEQNLMYFAVFGCYPIVRPFFDRMRQPVRMIAKLAVFNVVVVAVEALVMLVLVPEVMGAGMIIALLLMGNVTFLLYDFLIPRYEALLMKYMKRFLARSGGRN